MSVLTTELQQSNAANDNDVHKRGNGMAGHFQVLWCDWIATADFIAGILWLGLALTFS